MKTVSPLVDILRHSSPEGSASVLLDFRDSDDQEFSRRFTVHRNADDSIAWIPGPVTPKGHAQKPQPGIGNLARLRARLSLADKFPDEQKAAHQYLNEVEDLKKRLASVESQLKAWPQAAKFICWADECGDLRYRVMAANPESDTLLMSEFAALRKKIRNAISTEMDSFDLPEVLTSEDANNELQGLLWRTAGELKSHAASLLGTTARPTTS